VLSKAEGELKETHGDILTCAPGVSWYEVQLKEQKVFVKGSVPYEEVLAKIQKTGKEVGTSSVTMIRS
jgi:tRNA/tmRNA/rRNA uracil-C5-methylase (TrmA/RlmC/RlmD family)